MMMKMDAMQIDEMQMNVILMDVLQMDGMQMGVLQVDGMLKAGMLIGVIQMEGLQIDGMQTDVLQMDGCKRISCIGKCCGRGFVPWRRAYYVALTLQTLIKGKGGIALQNGL